jgi:hypothetical protein
MNTEPHAPALLARICRTLEETALADMGSAEARRQLKAGLWTIGRIAAALDTPAESLAAEIAYMERVLVQLGDDLSDCPAGPPRARHVALQARLADADRHAQAARAGGDPQAAEAVRALRMLYRRMLDRE